jgi:NADH-quinone oxidoreductase subunit N
MLYLSFETVGVCSYILAGHAKGNPRSTEAGFKYVLYGAAASGVLLYGLTYLSGIAGTTTMVAENATSLDIFDTLGMVTARDLFGGGNATDMFRQVTIQLIPIPLMMVLGGLLYKVAVFPFHFWAPDVYEGSPMPVTAIFSVLVKIAGFAVFVRFLYGYAFGVIRAVHDVTDGVGVVGFSGLTFILAVMSAITMTVGNLSACVQTNIKRMLAYSGIANAGYLLMGACVLTGWGESGYDVEGVFAVLFFLAVYLFANLGAFVVAIAIADHLGKEDIEDYAGLGRVCPILGVSMVVFLFSLIGSPPFAGFIGKFYLFYAVIRHQLYALAIIGVLNSVVSVFYYFRILRQMFLVAPPAGLTFDISTHYKAVLWMLMIPVIVLGVYFAPLSDVARAAAQMVVHPEILPAAR